MSSSSLLDTEPEFLVYTEVTDNPPEPTPEEINEYATRIGIDVVKEPELLFLAREGINHNLPQPWKPCLNKTRDVVFYLNEETQETQWEHPMDPIYRDRVVQARAELALSKIHNFDPLTKRPPNKDLPPIKRSGGGLAPINPISSSLGKLGGFGSAAEDLRQRTPPRPSATLNNDFSSSALSNVNNNFRTGRFNSGNNSKNIISESSLNSFKETDDDEDASSPLLVRPQPPRKIRGLTITGGGANFLKGSNLDGLSAGNKVGLFSSTKRDHESSTSGIESGGAGDSDKKPIKSILVNSISRSRPKNPTDNVYELDGFSMNLDEMTDEEKIVFSQLDSSTGSRSKGNVKFNLDENTELKFEMDEDDDEILDEEADGETDKTEEEDEESVSTSPNVEKEGAQARRNMEHNNGSGDSLHRLQDGLFQRRRSLENDVIVPNRTPPQYLPEYSDADIAAMKKSMHDEMEAELQKFKDQLEDERKTRKEQIQKHLEETIAQFRMEKDETLRRIRRDMDAEKVQEIDKAKREIENLLQEEVEEMKIRFDENLHQRRKELEEEHMKKIEELTAEYRKKEEEKVRDVLSQRSGDDGTKPAEDYKKHKEGLRDEHKKQIMQMKDYHRTILEKVRADLEAEEEKIREDYSRKRTEMIATFEQETEDLKKALVKSQEEALKNIQEEFESSKAALEKSLKASLDHLSSRMQAKSVSEANYNEKAADDELESLKIKYQHLESKYRTMRMELQQLTQEMSPSKRDSEAIKSKNKNDQTSLRSERLSPRRVLNNRKSVRSESMEVSETNHDSAHGSESNTDTNTSHYPSSEPVASNGRPKQKESDSAEDEVDNESGHQSSRINAALEALEVLKQEILDLKHNKAKKRRQNSDHSLERPPDSGRKSSSATTNNEKVSTPRRSSAEGSLSARKKSSGNTTSSKNSKSARSKVPSPPTQEFSVDYIPSPTNPKYVSQSVSVIPKNLSGAKSDPTLEDAHQRIVEDAKAFIRMQKNRLKDPSPIPNSTHLILPTTKNNLLLFDEKMLKSVSPRRPASIHLDLVSETESSGVSSLKDQRSSERKKLSKDIDDICNSLNNLDQQMRLVWSVVKEKQQMQQQPYLVQDYDTLSFLNATAAGSSDFTALLPNTVPMILGKSSSRICASLPTSARKPLVPPPSPLYNLGDNGELPTNVVPTSLIAGPRYSSLLSNNQTSSSQTVLDALRMSGLSTTRLDCTDLLKSLEDELKEFKTTKQKMLEKGPGRGSSTSLDKKISLSKQNNTSNNILEKTKDLQEWLKKY